MSGLGSWPKAGVLSEAVLLTTLLGANVAHAEPFTSYGAGLFVGMDLGDGSVTWGADVLATHDPELQLCSKDARSVYGPLTRFTLHGLSRPEFHFAAFGGKEIDSGGPGALAELGVGLAFPHGFEGDARLTPHTGVAFELSLAHLFLRQEWLIGSFPVGLGARYMPAFGNPAMCSIGRPQRDATGFRTAAHATHDGARSPRAPGATALAKEFRSLAQQEYESVPAFLQLASDLCALGAPLSLVQRARLAAHDELVHTRVCSELARVHGQDAFVPKPPTVQRRPLLRGVPGIERLALESWLDGCLGEGLAAALAKDIADAVQDERIAAAHVQIAADEQRHAELGWDILGWCIGVQPRVRETVRAYQGVRLRPPASPLGPAGRRALVAERQRRAATQRLAAC